jgi:spore germination cell wall hydrolase CwlJ-like protein
MFAALYCLTLAIYFEARGEPLTGQYLVGQVVLNRVASERYPDDVCGVVFQEGQFSFTSRPSLRMEDIDAQRTAASIALDLLLSYDAPSDVLYFYNPKLADPYWSKTFEYAFQVGNHRFMKP